ncbi:MAG: beta-ketoacyl-[acyl-carrier-protein] synthase family protein [Candidatus Bipolaricaulota bacterium]
MMRERVLVTGLGVVSPLGVGTDSLRDGLRQGRSGVVRMDDRVDLTGIRSKVGAPCLDFSPTDFLEKKRARRMGRASQLAVAAAKLALGDGGLNRRDGARGAVMMGTGIGAMEAMVNNHLAMLERGASRVSPFLAPVMMPNAPAAETSIEVAVTGPSLGVVTACAAGAHAVGLAWDYLRAGRVDWALAGGAEAVMLPLVFAAFDRMGALTPNPDPETASRPYDARRDGFVMGEGAGVVLMESESHARRRKAHALAEVVGLGSTCDAFHITAPPERGEGAREAMAQALSSAGISPDEVDYINGHGTATPLNDRAETRAIKELFGPRAYEIPVSSTKSQIGHLLGAAGGVETCVVALALAEGFVPATTTWGERDPECDLDCVPGRPREEPIRVALSNSFGFGGQNACLVLRAV